MPATGKWAMSIPLVLINTALMIFWVWILGTLFLFAAEVQWWLGLYVALTASVFLAALVVLSAGRIRHLDHLRDAQRVLACSFQGLWLNLAGVGLGVMLLISIPAIAVASS